MSARSAGVDTLEIAEDAPEDDGLSGVTEDQIAARASEIYLSGNGGNELEHWLRAERELLRGQNGEHELYEASWEPAG